MNKQAQIIEKNLGISIENICNTSLSDMRDNLEESRNITIPISKTPRAGFTGRGSILASKRSIVCSSELTDQLREYADKGIALNG